MSIPPRPLFLTRSAIRRYRARQFATLLAIVIGTLGTVLSLFFTIGYLITS